MRVTKIIKLADIHSWGTHFEYDAQVSADNKIIRKQQKVWSFTETQLKAFVKQIEIDALSKYEIIE